MTDVSRSTPRRVLRRASELGVHADCVAADIMGGCDSCALIFHSVFDEFYGHAKDAGEMLGMVLDDLRQDREEDK